MRPEHTTSQRETQPVSAGLRSPLQERTHRRIIHAALACYARQGIGKTSLEDVSREARLSRATVYNYFSGKDALVAAVIEHEQRALYEGLIDAVGRREGAEARFRAGFGFALTFLRGHPALRRALETEPEQVLPAMTVQAVPLVALAREALVPLLAPGLRPSVDAEAVAEWVTRVLLACVLVPGSALDLDDESGIDLALGLVWEGVSGSVRADRKGNRR